MSRATHHLFEIVALSERMLSTAKHGTEDRDDSQCAIVFGTLHDYALHLRKLAGEEIRRHRRGGHFDQEDEDQYRSFGGVL